MDQTKLEAILELDKKATKGPWEWEDWDDNEGENKFSLVAPPETRPGGVSKMFPDLGNRLLKDEECNISEEDRAFIALAREALPQLAKDHMAAMAVIEAANLILCWRGISKADDKEASDDWVKFLKENDYWDRYDGCCNCSLCTKAREEYKKSVERRLYKAVKAYRTQALAALEGVQK